LSKLDYDRSLAVAALYRFFRAATVREWWITETGFDHEIYFNWQLIVKR
jgi:hypothetical protein